MKKYILASLCGVAFFLPEVSQAEGVYVNAGIGSSQFEYAGSVHDTAWNLGVGYNFDKNFGAELGYAQLGKKSGSGSFGSLSVSGSAKVESVYLAGIGNWAVADEFSVFGKLGIAQNRLSVSGSVSGIPTPGAAATSKTDVFAAVGAAYQFTKDLAATIDYSYYGKVSDLGIKLSAWNVGLRYGF